MNALELATSPLADEVNNFGDTRGGAMAGPLGLLFIVLLAIATILLIRNMNKRLRRLPASFPDQRAERKSDVTPGEDDPAPSA